MTTSVVAHGRDRDRDLCPLQVKRLSNRRANMRATISPLTIEG